MKRRHLPHSNAITISLSHYLSLVDVVLCVAVRQYLEDHILYIFRRDLSRMYLNVRDSVSYCPHDTIVLYSS